MSFKIHLLIVSLIIIVLFVITQFVIGGKKEPVKKVVVETSPYTITIERASWGLNCRTPASDKKTDNYLQSDSDSPKIKENNVLYAVSQLCDVKPSCDILIDPGVLGEDPMPSCGYKMLQIEYRCFSVDRLRTVKANQGVLSIDCDKQLDNP